MFKKCLLPGTFAGGMKLLAKACLFHGDGCRDDKYTGYRRGGAPRGFHSRHECSGKAGYGHAGGRGDDSCSEMAMTMTAVVGR